ncbi:MAG TPA: regulatory protein RecX [Nitrospira sp.]|nr:regulatory protein RecX [Nitrospira sp.]
MRYLARFDRTAAQVERFLTRKGASSAQAKQILGRLSTLRYLDDRAYAARWIEATLARRPMAVERLKSELLARGLSESVAGEMIRKSMEEVDEEALARRAVFLQGRQGSRLLPQRVAGLLRRRGFAEDMIERIIRDCTQT